MSPALSGGFLATVPPRKSLFLLLFWLCWVHVVVRELLLLQGGLSCPAACRILVPPLKSVSTLPTLEGGFFPTGPPGNGLVPCTADLQSPGGPGWEELRSQF